MLCSSLFKVLIFSVQRIYSGFQVIEAQLAGVFFMETSDNFFRKFYGRHIDLVHKFDTYMSHILKDVFTNCDIYGWFPVILCKL